MARRWFSAGTIFSAAMLAGLCVLSATALSQENASEANQETVDETAEAVAREAVERAVEKAAEMAEEKAAEKAERKARRPDEWRGATTVHFFMFVIDIDDVDDAGQNFTANVYLRLRWKDERLADPGSSIRQMPLREVWNPQVIIANRLGLISKALPDVVEVHPDGTVRYRQRYTGKLSQPLNLAQFPMDQHTFTIHFISAANTAGQLKFVPDAAIADSTIVGGGIASELSLPDWKLLDHEVLPLEYNPAGEVRLPGFALRFKAERFRAYFLWQMGLPLALVVVMSWAAFWIPGEQIGVRIGVATSAILTLIAHRFILASLLPKLPYMTRMDHLALASTLFVFLALLAIVVTTYLSGHNRGVQAGRLDVFCRVAFPVMFFSMLTWFLAG